MLKLVRRSIVANLGRLILTLISVVLGVAFVSGSFVLADSLRAVFDQISEDAFAGVDAQVRAEEPELQSSATTQVRFDESVLPSIQELDEVAFAEAGIAAFEATYTLNDDGEINRPPGPPVFTNSWGGPSPVSAFTLVEGEAPVGQQIVVDLVQAEAAGFAVGDTVTVSIPGADPEDFELSGILDFGEGGTGGAYFNAFDLPTAQRLLGAEGVVDSIIVAGESGVGNDDLLAAIGQVLPSGVEVVSGDTVIGEQQDAFGGFIDIFGNVLLGFAIVVLFVSTFIIYNTFAILVGQRTKQLGLLRTIGASARQIRSMVLIEAVIIGVVASIIGLFGGLLVAQALKALFNSTGGGGFPDGPLEIRARTFIVVLIVGLGVTIASAMIPAFRASRVSPLEAVRSGGQKERSTTFRTLAGGAILVPGLILLLLGMFGSLSTVTGRLTALGVGGGLVFVGVSMLSALFAGPVAAALGAPIESMTSITGRIGRDNASRNPQRTSATATALMIGLALITGVSVLSASLLRTFSELLDEALTADLFVFEAAQGLPFDPAILDQIEALDEVDRVAGFAQVEIRLDDDVVAVSAYDAETGQAIVNFGVTDGVDGVSDTGIAVFVDEAEQRDLSLNDTVSVEFEDGFTTELTVEALFDDNSIVGTPFVIARSLSSQHVPIDQIGFAGVTLLDGADTEAGKAAVEQVLASQPQLDVQDNTEFQEETESQIASFQALVTGLLLLCLIVAFFGIVNTMALSVLERIREIGLLRAVGMTRGQLKAAVRWEAVIVAVFGSVLGVLMGLLLGWAAVIAIPDTFISQVAVPWGQVVFFIVVGAILGVLAAFFPARRAAKLNVLDAIAHD
jgi:putative ABC transport system permease protein